ncbi:MAG: hypothetical protein C0467_22745 [Planctomycetaceae bacterium]|nr:hypothetical protein [Planctomycetaceae bacterium]
MKVYAGDSFVADFGTDGFHLWVVVSDPFKNDKEVLIVNLTSVKGRYTDPACLVAVGDHPWVNKPSYVEYYEAQIHTDAYLDRRHSARSVTPWQPVSDSLLERIRLGATSTQNLHGDHLQLLQDQGLIPPPPPPPPVPNP